jgi:lipoate-protein ligase A
MATQVYISLNMLSDIHVSGSAYKIAKDRAYHHGTMLISSQLSTLGDVLHVSKVRLVYHTMLV